MLPFHDPYSFDGLPFSPTNFLNINQNPQVGEQVVPQSNLGEPPYADTMSYRNVLNSNHFDLSADDCYFITGSSTTNHPQDRLLTGSSANIDDSFVSGIAERSSGHEFLNSVSSASGHKFRTVDPSASSHEFLTAIPFASDQPFSSNQESSAAVSSPDSSCHWPSAVFPVSKQWPTDTSVSSQLHSSQMPSVTISYGQMSLFVAPSDQTSSFAVPSGQTSSFAAPSGQTSSFAAPSGQTSSFAAPSGQTSSFAAPSGQTSSFAAPSGRTSSFAAPSGQTSSFAAPSGQTSSFAAPSGQTSFAVAPSGQMTSVTTSSDQESSIIDSTDGNLWDFDGFDYMKMFADFESVNLELFDYVNDDGTIDLQDEEEYENNSVELESKNYPFIGKGNDITLTELNANENFSATKPLIKVEKIDVEDELKGQVFLPQASHDRFLVPDRKLEMSDSDQSEPELLYMPSKTYTPNFDHCYNRREPEEEVKVKEEPKERKVKNERPERKVNEKCMRKIEEECKKKIKEEPKDEESETEDSSADDVDVETVSEDDEQDQYCMRKRTRPIVRPKRFSQRENTPPVRQYKRTCTKKETTQVATALLRQAKPNQRNTKTPGRRGRKPGNSLNSSGNSSRACSDADEPRTKRREHNSLERQRRIVQKTYLDEVRKSMPHFKNEKASKVSIIFGANSYIKSLKEEEHKQLKTLRQLQKRNAFLIKRRDLLLSRKRGCISNASLEGR